MSFEKTPDEKFIGRKLTKYDRVVIALFRNLTDKLSKESLPKEIYFDQDDVRAAAQTAIGLGWIKTGVKNIADVKYTYDARRNLPDECEQCGHLTWLQVSKGKYKFVRTARRNIIVLPDDVPFEISPVEPEFDQTPPFVASLLGNDEQAVFTRIRNSGLIQKFLGFNSWPIQGHHRTTVSYGQIEVDEVQAGLDGPQRVIVPISGKGGQDKLSWSQALNLNTYGAEKPLVKGLETKSIGLWRDKEETIWMVEFTPETDIELIQFSKVRRFKLVTQ